MCFFVACFQEGLRVWARQIQEGFCLFDGKRIPEDMELTSGQVVWICTTQKNWSASLYVVFWYVGVHIELCYFSDKEEITVGYVLH